MYNDASQQIFIQAIIDGDLGTVRKMVSDGMDVNARGKYGIIPLYFAIHFPKKEIFFSLIQQAADSTIEIDYSPAEGRKYRLLTISAFWVALNDLAPGYLVEIMKFSVSIKNDTLWEYFCAGSFFPAGCFRGVLSN